ncbi:MAG: DUF3024 domain-containing protein [Alphaproteobacteria bacterium]|nr:DUF3024 domain-containing protein [Alphaproteobacteria bacterium]
MAFTDDELAHIDATVGALVRRRQPPEHLRDKLRLEVEIDGHKVRIVEVRPSYRDPTQETRSGVAQFTYTRTQDRWTLHWKRADAKWHAWKPASHLVTLPALVRIVDEDAHGGFWG